MSSLACHRNGVNGRSWGKLPAQLEHSTRLSCKDWLNVSTQIHIHFLMTGCICSYTLDIGIGQPASMTQYSFSHKSDEEYRNQRLIDWVKVLSPIQYSIGHFGDVLPSYSLGLILKKPDPTQQKQKIQNKMVQANTKTQTMLKQKKRSRLTTDLHVWQIVQSTNSDKLLRQKKSTAYTEIPCTALQWVSPSSSHWFFHTSDVWSLLWDSAMATCLAENT